MPLSKEIDHCMKFVNSLYTHVQPEMEPDLLHKMQHIIPEMNRLLHDMSQESQANKFLRNYYLTSI